MTASLKDTLLAPQKRPALVHDCAQLVDAEVGQKSGLSGMVIKGAYALVKALKPGIIREAVDRLLDDFVAALEPVWSAYQSAGAGDVAQYFNPRASEIADHLLGITDRRIARADNATIKKAYEKLRPQGKKHVEAAVPGIARVVAKHA